jgi:hypothetical protein
MKSYDISFSFAITDTSVSYDTKKVISVQITEKLPLNVNPEKYMKQRLAEEVKRSFGSLVGEIENITEEAKESNDPLDF